MYVFMNYKPQTLRLNLDLEKFVADIYTVTAGNLQQQETMFPVWYVVMYNGL